MKVCFKTGRNDGFFMPVFGDENFFAKIKKLFESQEHFSFQTLFFKKRERKTFLKGGPFRVDFLPTYRGEND